MFIYSKCGLLGCGKRGNQVTKDMKNELKDKWPQPTALWATFDERIMFYSKPVGRNVVRVSCWPSRGRPRFHVRTLLRWKQSKRLLYDRWCCLASDFQISFSVLSPWRSAIGCNFLVKPTTSIKLNSTGVQPEDFWTQQTTNCIGVSSVDEFIPPLSNAATNQWSVKTSKWMRHKHEIYSECLPWHF